METNDDEPQDRITPSNPTTTDCPNDVDEHSQSVENQNSATSLVGTYLTKDFPCDATTGTRPPSLLGKVTTRKGRLFTVLYEDGTCEYLDLLQVRQNLLPLGEYPSHDQPTPTPTPLPLLSRKRKLDHFISLRSETARCTRSRIKAIEAQAAEEGKHEQEGQRGSAQPHASQSSTSSLDRDHDASSGDSCISTPVPPSSDPTPLSPPVLPLSSADIAIPEQVVPSLFSVYSFLTSFSCQLFLSPFRLDEFVGALNCTSQNSLLEAIHVSLMRVLRHHLKSLEQEGSQCITRCLRLLDWSLIDNLTWPVFLMEYILVMGHTKQMEDCKGFFKCILDQDYYRLAVPYKLLVLQVLCDDVIESAVLRTELEKRENLDEEMDDSANLNLCNAESRPRRVHPRYSKTSACKNIGRMQQMSTTEQSWYKSNIKETDEARVLDVDQDGNSDECQLCGMDGMLLCCDGCPSAYHFRCIGLNKASIRNDSWLCPECTVKKGCAASCKVSTGIRGGELFGMDPFGQVFVGSHNYLIVFYASWHAIEKSVCRYYNQNDIIKVMHVLSSTKEISSLYAEICRAISVFWEIPFSEFLHHHRSANSNYFIVENVNTMLIESSNSTVKRNPTCFRNSEVENHANFEATNTPVKNDQYESTNIDSLANESCENACNDLSFKNTDDEPSVFSSHKTSHNATIVQKDQFRCLISHDQLVTKPMIVTSKFNLQTDASMNSHSFNCLPSNGFAVCPPNREDTDTTIVSTNYTSLIESDQRRSDNYTCIEENKDSRIMFSYKGTSFRHQAYTNQYANGETAASAAAHFSLLTAEEGNLFVAQTSSNARKAFLAAKTMLQLKAFAAAMHFMWPSFEKKTSDATREKCGWCMACSNENTYKKGCLLNTIINANRYKVPSSLRPTKNGNNVAVIAAFILQMEENLHGLTEDFLLDTKYNMKWRKSVKEASTCRALKPLLLELERNVRRIAFSDGWFKLVDDWSVELSDAETCAFFSGTHHKRGRKRKLPAATEIPPTGCVDSWKEVQWWRGGRLQNMLFQRGMLPCLLAKRMARQGGTKEEVSVHYSDCRRVACRTRQIAWRISVEKSRSAYQLALQVRCLDAHIRWRDIVRPEQGILEGKIEDADVSIFRNATIFEKKKVDNRLAYALAFNTQKHLPLRVTKNILETECSPDEKKKLWFSENYVPLYLIKEYEENAAAVSIPRLVKVSESLVSQIQKRWLNFVRRDIFLYLSQKSEKSDTSFCASCKQDTLGRDAEKCMSCRGSCHKECLMTAAYDVNGISEIALLCNTCYQHESSASTEKHKYLNYKMTTVIKTEEPSTCNFIVPLAKDAINSEIISPPASSSEQKGKNVSRFSSGLIWKKKSRGTVTDDGEKFRSTHLILKGDASLLNTSIKEPSCTLCHEPYNPDLMYIRCETCLRWYHGESVHLNEDHISEVVGFRCCRCRRKASPQCPYSRIDDKKIKSKLGKRSKHSGLHDNSIYDIPNQRNFTHMSQPKPTGMIVSPRGMEQPMQIAANQVSGYQQNLYTRLHSSYSADNREPCSSGDAQATVAGVSGNPSVISAKVNLEQEFESKGSPSMLNVNKMLTSCYTSAPQVDSYHSRVNSNLEATESLTKNNNNDDMEYEPQTYFSFTELLESGDDELGFPCDMLIDLPENLENQSDYVEKDSVRLEDITSHILGPPGVQAVEEHGTGSIDAVSRSTVVCKKCNLNDGAPHLACEICGLTIHLHCSPWEELKNPSEATWRCGTCREWR